VTKIKAKSLYGFFTNSKPTFTILFLVTIICVMNYIVGMSYANNNNRMAMIGPDIKRSETSRDKDSGEWQTVRMRVTAYCPCQKCCGKYSDGVTACGHKICQGDSFVAADIRYPFGTEMIIPGYKNGETVEVLDRGGVIRGDRLDVFFNYHHEALKWGVRYLDVKVCRR